jgi:hypothetical protein
VPSSVCTRHNSAHTHFGGLLQRPLVLLLYPRVGMHELILLFLLFPSSRPSVARLLTSVPLLLLLHLLIVLLFPPLLSSSFLVPSIRSPTPQASWDQLQPVEARARQVLSFPLGSTIASCLMMGPRNYNPGGRPSLLSGPSPSGPSSSFSSFSSISFFSLIFGVFFLHCSSELISQHRLPLLPLYLVPLVSEYSLGRGTGPPVPPSLILLFRTSDFGAGLRGLTPPGFGARGVASSWIAHGQPRARRVRAACFLRRAAVLHSTALATCCRVRAHLVLQSAYIRCS